MSVVTGNSDTGLDDYIIYLIPYLFWRVLPWFCRPSLLLFNRLSASRLSRSYSLDSYILALIFTTILETLVACFLINAKSRITSPRRAIGSRIVYILAYRIRRRDPVNTGGVLLPQVVLIFD